MSPDQRRQRALSIAFSEISSRLLKDQAPEPQDLVLLTAAVVDAALAGDRDLLAIVPGVIERLRRYTPEDEAWAEVWRGQLLELQVVAQTAAALLQLEAEGAAR